MGTKGMLPRVLGDLGPPDKSLQEKPDYYQQGHNEHRKNDAHWNIRPAKFL